MKKIVVIGTGNIGLRHLQSLSQVSEYCLYGVDPDSKARQKAIEELNKTENKQCHSINLYPSINEMCKDENSFDLAVIAVNSGARCAVTEELIEKTSVANILFEKVLFNKLSEYEKISNLLQSKGIPAWVNCVKRSYPYYRELKKRLGFGNSPVSLKLCGNMWGLGCNTIHYVDFLAFLSDTQKPFLFNTTMLNHEIIESKRREYIEFTGTIKASSGDNRLSLTSNIGSFDGFKIIIEDNNYLCEIEERGSCGNNIITEKQSGQQVEEKFEIPFQSKLTDKIADEIFSTGNCCLTRYNLSAQYHYAMLKAFIDFVGEDNDRCNIT